MFLIPDPMNRCAEKTIGNWLSMSISKREEKLLTELLDRAIIEEQDPEKLNEYATIRATFKSINEVRF